MGRSPETEIEGNPTSPPDPLTETTLASFVSCSVPGTADQISQQPMNLTRK